jgi:hypothetical protein
VSGTQGSQINRNVPARKFLRKFWGELCPASECQDGRKQRDRIEPATGLAKNPAQLFTLFGFANLVPAGDLRYPTAELRPERPKTQLEPQFC